LSYKLGLFFSFFHYEFDLLKRIHETIVFGNTKIGYFLQCWFFYKKRTGRDLSLQILIFIFPRRCPFGTLPLGWFITGFQPKDLQKTLATKAQ